MPATISAPGEAASEPLPDEHHDHLIDLRTGDVIEFRDEEIEKLQRAIADRLGYRLVDHRLELYAVPLKDRKAPKAKAFGRSRFRHPRSAYSHRLEKPLRSIKQPRAPHGPVGTR